MYASNKGFDQTAYLLSLSWALADHWYDKDQNLMYSKTCLKRPLKKKTKNGFQDRISLNAGQKGSIMQYFPPIH